MKVAFVGLGVMGYPMAGHLSRAGFDVSVYNRTTSTAERWASEYAGTVCNTPAEAAARAEHVFACVGNDDDVRAVMLGDTGILSGVEPGALVIDHTTASASLARELHALCAEKDIGFLDAPVSGGEAGAVNGQLSIMVGGDAADVERARESMNAYAKSITHIGEAGSGQLAKMVNQICIAGLVQGLSEGLHFAKRAGLDVATVIDAIGKGAAQSWQMDNRWETMRDGRFDFGFAVDWMRKDLAIAFEEASRNGARLEVAELVDTFYAEVQSMGGSRWDTSSLIARLEGDTRPRKGK
ncbi:MAG: NAD(P)-dependent oxidoreductase [Woeseiaceae bacterium]|nr:NAD(P)-dependent oxidoreductase [Woeseiaceae bacterium]